jgi:hypothetical protein
MAGAQRAPTFASTTGGLLLVRPGLLPTLHPARDDGEQIAELVGNPFEVALPFASIGGGASRDGVSLGSPELLLLWGP